MNSKSESRWNAVPLALPLSKLGACLTLLRQRRASLLGQFVKHSAIGLDNPYPRPPRFAAEGCSPSGVIVSPLKGPLAFQVLQPLKGLRVYESV